MDNCFLMLTPYSAVMMITSPISSTISSSSVISMFLPTDLSSTIYISPAALSFHQHSLYWAMAMWLCGYLGTVCTTPIPPFLTASS